MPPLIFLNSHPIQYFAPLYRYLARAGTDVTVLYCSGQAQTGNFDAGFGQTVRWDIPLLEGYPHVFFSNYGIGGKGSKGFLSLINPSVAGYLFKRKKSLVVIHSWQYATDWLAIVSARLAGHRIALWTEANQAQEALHPAWKRFIKKCFMRGLFFFVHDFWCIGTQNRLFYQHFGIAPERLFHTPYSVDNDRFRAAAAATGKAAARQALGLPLHTFIVLYSGKYISKKRPLDLLQALAACKQPNNLHLVMAGDGALRASMEQFISDNNLQKCITLTGFVNQSAIPLYYKAADLFVMCSGTGETWGLSVNEAMNFSLPLLVSSLTGCSADLVSPGVNGYVFETGDISAISAYLDQFSAMAPEELARMGKASLKIVSQYSYAKILEGISKNHKI